MTGRGRGAGVDDERAQFRLLFRTFLGGLFENDLVPETVDLRQSALWLAAVFMIPPAIFALFVSLSYGSWMTDEELALRAVPQKLYFIGYSMAAVGFVTVLVWDKLFPDRRDAIVAGSLPIRTRTLVFARLSALVAVVVGFAIVVNLPGTVIFSFVAGNYLPLEAFLRYPVAHFMATVSAGLLVFLALAALQACLALVLPVRLLRRVSMLAQLLFVVLLIEWLVFAPGLLVRLAAIDPGATSEALAAADGPYRFVGLTSSRAGIWLPPVWFLGVYEVIWGSTRKRFEVWLSQACWRSSSRSRSRHSPTAPSFERSSGTRWKRRRTLRDRPVSSCARQAARRARPSCDIRWSRPSWRSPHGA